MAYTSAGKRPRPVSGISWSGPSKRKPGRFHATSDHEVAGSATCFREPIWTRPESSFGLILRSSSRRTAGVKMSTRRAARYARTDSPALPCPRLPCPCSRLLNSRTPSNNAGSAAATARGVAIASSGAVALALPVQCMCRLFVLWW